MKNLLSTLLLLAFFGSVPLSGQSQTGIRFGLKTGYSLGTQYGTIPPDIPYEIDSDSRHGFTGGIFLYFPITEAFGVQQEFLYTNKGSGQNITMTQPPLSTSTDYKLNYFELPILFRYTFVKVGDFGIYGSTGFGLSMLLSGEYSLDGIVDVGGGTQIPFSESGSTDGVDKFDYSFIYGLGFNFNLFNQDWFFDYRQTIGWNTLNMPTSEGADPAPLRNQTYSFTLGIMF